MIRLTKLAPPPVLIQNAAAWSAEYQGGTDNRRYAHDDIRTILREKFRRKCAYCESRVKHVYNYAC